MSGHGDLHAGGEDGLAGVGGDGAGVGDVRSYQHDPAAVAAAAGGAFQQCSGLHGDVAIASACRCRAGIEVGGAIGTTGHAQAGKQELGIAVVEQALFDKVVVDRQRRNRQASNIHPAATAEDDAVAVDDVDLAVGLDRAENLGGIAGRVADLVEGNPLADVFSAGLLVEAEGGVLADVEGLPIEQRLLGRLLDRDFRAAIGRAGLRGEQGTAPFGGIRGDHWGHLQTARGNSVRNTGQRQQLIRRVFAQRVGTGNGGIASGVLHGPHGIQRATGAGQGIECVGPGGISGSRGGRATAAGCVGNPIRVRSAPAAAQDVAGVGTQAADENREADKGGHAITERRAEQEGFPEIDRFGLHGVRPVFFALIRLSRTLSL